MVLAREELGLEVVERPIDRTEVFVCDEFFLAGTAAQVTAVTRVDRRPVGAGVMGPTTSRLRKMYDDILRGRVAKSRHRIEPVYVEVAAHVKWRREWRAKSGGAGWRPRVLPMTFRPVRALGLLLGLLFWRWRWELPRWG